jgi:hypothetical protein
MLNVTREMGRGNLISLDYNPRSRYTLWNCLFGLLVGWMSSYGLAQHNFMRIKATRSVTQARLLMLSIIPFGCLNLALISLIGFVAFVYFYKCGDPFTSGMIKNQNQLVAKFLTQFYGEYNGLLGMFVGVLVASSIGSISNILKALSITLTEDIFKKTGLFSKRDSLQLCNGNSGLKRENTLVRQQQRASEKQLELLYGEELLKVETRNLTRNHKRFLRKYKKKMGLTTRKLDVLLIIVSALLMTAVAVALERVPGSLTAIAFSILNSLNGPILFIYLCARFNEYSKKRFTYASNVGRRSKLRNFRFQAADVVASCVCAIAFLQFLYIGQLVTGEQHADFYDFERGATRPVTLMPSEELQTFCQYEERNVTETVVSYAATSTTAAAMRLRTVTADVLKQQPPGVMNYLFGISFNWYTSLGFSVAVLVLAILNVFRILFWLVVICVGRMFCSFQRRNILFL